MIKYAAIMQRVLERQGGEKVTRSAFLYLDPKEPKDQFAQCATCVMWTGKDRERCTILGPEVPVYADSTCGLYVPGEPSTALAGQEVARLKPEEAGLVRAQVRCENCVSLKGTTCRAFRAITQAMPNDFDLDDQVDPKGCCNGWRPKK